MPLTSIVFALFIASVASAQTPPASTQLMSLQTVTVTEEQFLTGSRDGRPVTIAAELRFPSAGTERVPAMILLHGSGGINAQDVQWAKELNDLGVATLLVDSFTGRGIVSTVGDQGRLSELTVTIDAYRALEQLAQHPRIDPRRIGVFGRSRGAVSALYAGVKRFQRMYMAQGAEFAVYLSFYPACSRTYIDDADVGERPIRIFHGTADDIAPVEQCRSHVKRLQAAGKDVQLTEYAGAYHGFDNPAIPPTRVPVGKSQAKRGGCTLYEQSVGRIMNRDTGLPFTRNDECLKGVGTLAYDGGAHARAIQDVTAVLQQALTLNPARCCGRDKTDTRTDEEQIAQNIAAWKELGKTGDTEKILTYFADDVMIFPAGQPVLKGRDAVRRLVEDRTGPRRTTTWDVPASITVARAGDLAYVVTGNSVTTTDATGRSETVRNKGIQVWRKEANGSWKELIVIVNPEPLQ